MGCFLIADTNASVMMVGGVIVFQYRWASRSHSGESKELAHGKHQDRGLASELVSLCICGGQQVKRPLRGRGCDIVLVAHERMTFLQLAPSKR